MNLKILYKISNLQQIKNKKNLWCFNFVNNQKKLYFPSPFINSYHK